MKDKIKDAVSEAASSFQALPIGWRIAVVVLAYLVLVGFLQ